MLVAVYGPIEARAKNEIVDRASLSVTVRPSQGMRMHVIQFVANNQIITLALV